MSVVHGIKTGLAALTIAAAPLASHAQKAAGTAVKDSVKAERFIEKAGNKLFESAGKDAFANFKLGVDYSSRQIVGLRTHEPRVKFVMDAQPSPHTYFRPELAFGTESYGAVLPLGFKTNIGTKGFSYEAGAEAGIKGFYNKKSLFNTSVEAVQNNAACKTHPVSGEFFQDINTGFRYKNNTINASIRGEAGRNMYIDSDGLIYEGKGLDAAGLETADIPVVKKPNNLYVGAKADVEITPFKNKNLSINAEGAVATNRAAEGSIGAAYKF